MFQYSNVFIRFGTILIIGSKETIHIYNTVSKIFKHIFINHIILGFSKNSNS
nr:MAG TPA: hypothetical protein [Caudoviricetes sp.]